MPTAAAPAITTAFPAPLMSTVSTARAIAVQVLVGPAIAWARQQGRAAASVTGLSGVACTVSAGPAAKTTVS